MNLEKILCEESDLNKVLVFGDKHVPFDDKKAYKVMMQYAKNQYKPDIIVLLGDILDFYSLSKFDKNPSRVGDIQQDLNIVNDMLYKLRKDFPKAEIYLEEGNHESVHKYTDILTINGWKNVTEVTKEDFIGEFDIESKEISFSKPLDLISHKSEFLIDIESNNQHQIVTMNHDVIIDDKKIKASELLDKEIFQTNMPVFGNYESPGINLNNDWIKLITWVVMDGCLVKNVINENNTKRRIQFKLSKYRKIEVLKELLEKMNIKYTFKECKKSGINKLQPYYIRIYSDSAREIFNILNDIKELPKDWKFMNRAQLNILIKTLSITDGCQHYNHIIWSTINKNNLDIVQQACIQNNISCYYKTSKNRSGFNSKNEQYVVNIFNNGITNNKLDIKKIEYNDLAYCFTMSKGTLITRFDGKVAFTGNCRLKKYLWKHAELLQLDALKLETLLELKKNKIKYVGSDPDYWSMDAGHLKLGDVIIMHGDNRINGAKGGKYASQNTMLSINHKLVMGHTHRLNISHYDNKYINLFAINTGCLCKLPSMADWQVGFATFELDKGIGINPRVHQIFNGTLYVDGKVYK